MTLENNFNYYCYQNTFDDLPTADKVLKLQGHCSYNLFTNKDSAASLSLPTIYVSGDSIGHFGEQTTTSSSWLIHYEKLDR